MENILIISGIIFLSLLALSGVAGVVYLYFLLVKRAKEKEKLRDLNIFKMNFQQKLIDENNRLIETLNNLVEESLDLAKKNEMDEEYSQMKEYSNSMKEQIDIAFNNFSKDEDIDSSLASLTLLKLQLENMAEKIDENIVLMKEKLGEERVLN
jgi:uncharacterized membrane protein YgaE (UPF0421/DUF939 family)